MTDDAAANQQDDAGGLHDEGGLPEPPRRKIPSRRAIAIAAGILGVADVALVHSTDAGWTQAILNGVAMAAFVYFGMRAVVKVRLGYRPEPPADRDPSQPPPPGGWASPTKGQGLVRRLRRLSRDARPPRTPRSRR